MGIQTATQALSNESSTFSFRNKVINGNFDIWQRATTATYSGDGSVMQTADRWLTYVDTASTSRTISRQEFTTNERGAGVEPAKNSRYHLRTSWSVSTSSTIQQFHKIEGLRQFAGKTVTLSFYAKADRATTLNTFLYGVGGGANSDSYLTGMTDNPYTLSTSWQKFTFKLTIPSMSAYSSWNWTENECMVIYLYQGTITSNIVIDTAQVQLEIGNVATPFENRPVGLELLLCQRYYQAIYGSMGVTRTTTRNWINNTLNVTMRSSPSVSLNTSTTYVFDDGQTGHTVTPGQNISIVNNECTKDALRISIESTIIGYNAVRQPLMQAAGPIILTSEL